MRFSLLLSVIRRAQFKTCEISRESEKKTQNEHLEANKTILEEKDDSKKYKQRQDK